MLVAAVVREAESSSDILMSLPVRVAEKIVGEPGSC